LAKAGASVAVGWIGWVKVFQAVASNHQSEMLRLLRKVREIFVQTDMFIMIYNSFTFI
jgi:hypothetical protein